MATSNSSIYLRIFHSMFFFWLISSLLYNDYAHVEATHAIQVSSLFPSASCAPSGTTTKVGGQKPSLEVVHKHGPCYRKWEKDTDTLDHNKILLQDLSRVNSILGRFKPTKIETSSDVILPTKSGIDIGTGDYVVTVGLGTPPTNLTLLFDTGSSLTWTQCQPCTVGSCYPQIEPMFDPSKSSSYTQIFCGTDTCNQLLTATGFPPVCSGTSCGYRAVYGDLSYSSGLFGKETLTLSPTDVIKDFKFGCGQNNNGSFGEAAGVIGLGRDELSFVEQSASEFGKYFSYCIPSTTSSTGYLTFGKGDVANNTTSFTPITTNPHLESFYGIDIIGISVEGQPLSIPPAIFSTAKAIIDSGTVLTRLPPTAYTALRTAFRQHMTDYPLAPSFSILDTCYDLSQHDTVILPKVSFTFGGNTVVDLSNPHGVLFAIKASQVCLAFAPSKNDGELAIFGNVQQKTLEIVYDVAGEKIEFGPNGCS